jgi:ATP-binding protein involved in chromosome partitioning
MSYFTSNEEPEIKHFIFGESGVKYLAKDLDINFLGEIPIFTSLREASDFGRPGSLQENSVIENIFREISKLLVEELIKRNNELPPTKIVKITNLVGCSAVKKKS